MTAPSGRLPRDAGSTPSQKIALVCGASGQDGSYLSRFLLDKGYAVVGTSRDAQTSGFRNLVRLAICDRVTLTSMSPTDFRSVLQVLQHVRPDEVYNLTGQSSVGLSFDQPVETLESIATATLNILEAIRFSGLPTRFYSAGSGEVFGDTDGEPANELTRFAPRSPYAVAKAAAYWQVATYREAYRLYACTGILFNHESPLRPERFVTRKIVAAASRIAAGSGEMLRLGNLDIERDWGWAPEYVEAMWLMLQQDRPDDFVIATGETRPLRDFVAEAFSRVGLDWCKHVRTDGSLMRPADIRRGSADPRKALALLGWRAHNHLNDVVQMMLDAELSE
ncbi:MAG: GDP-mannose 4,6-dehydratase [Gemmatimonadaceae bacterium]